MNIYNSIIIIIIIVTNTGRESSGVCGEKKTKRKNRNSILNEADKNLVTVSPCFVFEKAEEESEAKICLRSVLV